MTCQSQIVYMDGTFKSCPLTFKQLYSIHIHFMDNFFTTIMALLPNKTKQTYIRFLKKLQEESEHDLRLVRQGKKIKVRNKKYDELDKEIKFHLKQYQTGLISALDFLDFSSLCLCNKKVK